MKFYDFNANYMAQDYIFSEEDFQEMAKNSATIMFGRSVVDNPFVRGFNSHAPGIAWKRSLSIFPSTRLLAALLWDNAYVSIDNSWFGSNCNSSSQS